MTLRPSHAIIMLASGIVITLAYQSANAGLWWSGASAIAIALWASWLEAKL